MSTDDDGNTELRQDATAHRDAYTAGRDQHFHLQNQPPPPTRPDRVWGSVPAHNPAFTGREELLRQIRGALMSGDRGTVQTLRGKRGVGKTRIAVEYVHQRAADYVIVWWINAEDRSSISKRLAALAERLGCAAPDAPVDSAVRAVLEHLHATAGWLLVFDNAASPEVVEPYLPGGPGHVLITSRATGWHSIAATIEIGVLTRAESVKFLHEKLRKFTAEDAATVAAAVHDLPAALARAVSDVDRPGISAAEYARNIRTAARKRVALVTAGAAAPAVAALIAFLVFQGQSNHSGTPTSSLSPTVIRTHQSPPATSSGSNQTANPAGPVCAAGSLQLVGSTAFGPIVLPAASAYMYDCPGSNIEIASGDSAYGVTAVRNKVASHDSSARSWIAMFDGNPSPSYVTGLQSYPIGVIIFSVVAHTGLFPGLNVTTSELHDIFAAPGVPGTVAVGRQHGSGSRLTFFNQVIKMSPGTPVSGNCPTPTGQKFSFTGCTEDGTPQLLNFVNETPNAIGYAEVSEPLSGDPDIEILRIDNVQPSETNVLNRSYAYWTIEHLYASPDPTALARDFLKFLPTYFANNAPSDFFACSAATKSLEGDCR